MEWMIKGLNAFQREVFPAKNETYNKLAHSQHPRALLLTCADSRIVPDLLFQTEPGDLFIARNAGNIIPPFGVDQGGVSASIEYGLVALGIRDVVVCGHSDCGAMRALLKPESLERLPQVRHWLRHAEAARHIVEQEPDTFDLQARLRRVTEENVRAQIIHLQTYPFIASLMARGEIRLHGWYYEIATGTVFVNNAAGGRFEELRHREPLAAEVEA